MLGVVQCRSKAGLSGNGSSRDSITSAVGGNSKDSK